MICWPCPRAGITEAGLRNNVSVALQYIDAWTRGNGAVAIYGLMEDAATAEISRSQLWQWINHGSNLEDGRPITAELYRQVRAEEAAASGRAAGPGQSRRAGQKPWNCWTKSCCPMTS